MKSNLQVRTTSPTARLGLIAVVLMLVALPVPVYAVLGGDVGSIQTDQASMNASQRISAATENYTVYELQTPTGTTVREYLSMAGTVFAVAWQGPLLPDLRQLLGANYKAYTGAAAGRHAGQEHHADHGHLDVHLPDLVVESNGRVRSFFGRAYLPQGLPQGVAVAEIQ